MQNRCISLNESIKLMNQANGPCNNLTSKCWYILLMSPIQKKKQQSSNEPHLIVIKAHFNNIIYWQQPRPRKIFTTYRNKRKITFHSLAGTFVSHHWEVFRDQSVIPVMIHATYISNLLNFGYHFCKRQSVINWMLKTTVTWLSSRAYLLQNFSTHQNCKQKNRAQLCTSVFDICLLI